MQTCSLVILHVLASNLVLVWGPTFDMSGGRKWAKPACGRPLDGRVRRHLLCKRETWTLNAAASQVILQSGETTSYRLTHLWRVGHRLLGDARTEKRNCHRGLADHFDGHCLQYLAERLISVMSPRRSVDQRDGLGNYTFEADQPVKRVLHGAGYAMCLLWASND